MTWLDLPPDAPFGAANLPYGVFSAGDGSPRVGVRIGEEVLDLARALGEQVFAEPALNAFMAQGRARWGDVRARITELLADERHRATVEAALRPLAHLRLHLPFVPGDSRRLDFEAEVGFVIGTGSARGTPVSVAEFADHVFGVFLVNDWSARDIQAWESAPLGPFLAKSFATSVSPWVVPLQALEHAWVSPLRNQDPEPLPYLAGPADRGLDLALEVRLNGHLVSRPPFATMYWTAAQMLAHMTVNGASVRTGDFYASGTVSGPEPGQRGCLLELSWGGSEPLTLADGSVRSFLEDQDVVAVTATAPAADGARIGFGEVTGQILPAVEG